MIWLKLALLAAALAAAIGMKVTYDGAQQEKGAAIVRAQLAEAKSRQDARIAQLARKAQAAAEKAVAVAESRRSTIQNDLTVAELERSAANEQLTRKDTAYAEWHDRPLPRAVIDELRDALSAAGAGQSGGGLP